MIVTFCLFLFLFCVGVCFAFNSSLENTPLSYDPLQIRWLALSFNSKNFLCSNYAEVCNNYLDQINCDESSRLVSTCTNSSLALYHGSCKCNGNPIFDDKTARISKELIDNRIKGEIGWMLEPWSDGPPYAFYTSYKAICQLALYRLGCDVNQMTIAPASGLTTATTWKCQCGTYTDTNVRISELITDKLNEATLSELIVFQDPTVLTVEASIAIALLVGKISSIVASLFYLPPIIGFLLGGVAIQDVISPSMIKGVGGNGPHSTPFGEIRIFALIIIIMKAGLTLKLSDVIKTGYMSLALALIPYLCEFAAIMGIGIYLLGWNSLDMGLLASILAALSPSLVIPGTIKMVREKLGYTPRSILTSAPLEVVFADILYSIFASLEQAINPQYPWVVPLPLYAKILLIPVNIMFSCVLGFIVGMIVVKYIEIRENSKNLTVNRILEKNAAEYLFYTIVLCYLLYALCQTMYIQKSSGIVAVISMTLTMAEFGDPTVLDHMYHGLEGLWVFLEVFLFTSTGMNLSFNSTTGPLQSQRGLSQRKVSLAVQLLLVGTCGRAAGLLLVQLLGFFTLAPHRRNIKYIAMWWLATWMIQIPKATVQATLGPLPFQLHLIPGINGLNQALLIQQITAFAILFMAPIGVFLTLVVAKPIVKILQQIDAENGFLDDGTVVKTIGSPEEVELENPHSTHETNGEYEFVPVSSPKRNVLAPSESVDNIELSQVESL